MRHADIHNNCVRIQLFRLPYGVKPIRGFAANFETVLCLQKPADTGPHNLVVVNDENTHAGSGSAFTNAWNGSWTGLSGYVPLSHVRGGKRTTVFFRGEFQ